MFKQAFNPSAVDEITDPRVKDNGNQLDSFQDCLDPGSTQVFPYKVDNYRTLDKYEILLRDMKKTQDKHQRLKMLVDFTSKELKAKYPSRKDEVEGFSGFMKDNSHTDHATFEVRALHKIDQVFTDGNQKSEIKSYISIKTLLMDPKFGYMNNDVIQNTPNIGVNDLKNSVNGIQGLFTDGTNNPTVTYIGQPLFKVLNQIYPLPTMAQVSQDQKVINHNRRVQNLSNHFYNFSGNPGSKVGAFTTALSNYLSDYDTDSVANFNKINGFTKFIKESLEDYSNFSSKLNTEINTRWGAWSIEATELNGITSKQDFIDLYNYLSIIDSYISGTGHDKGTIEGMLSQLKKFYEKSLEAASELNNLKEFLPKKNFFEIMDETL